MKTKRKIALKKKIKKFTAEEVANKWKKMYGENLKKEYSGFWRSLKNKK